MVLKTWLYHNYYSTNLAGSGETCLNIAILSWKFFLQALRKCPSKNILPVSLFPTKTAIVITKILLGYKELGQVRCFLEEGLTNMPILKYILKDN